jgi:hypothetical protein
MEVFIKCLDRNEPYKTFVKRENDRVSGTTSVERYIEVEDGQRFSVVVVVTNGFNFHGAKGMQISLHIDDGVAQQWYFETEKKLKEGAFEISTAGQMVVDRMVEAGFSFGHLKLGELNL